MGIHFSTKIKLNKGQVKGKEMHMRLRQRHAKGTNKGTIVSQRVYMSQSCHQNYIKILLVSSHLLYVTLQYSHEAIFLLANT